MTIEYINPWGNYEIDPSTGLPVLPKGYYVRVKNYTKSYVRVSIRKRVAFIFFREITYGVLGKSDLNEKTLKAEVAYALYDRKWKEHRAAKVKPVWRTDLLGNYPPKSIATQPKCNKKEKK